MKAKHKIILKRVPFIAMHLMCLMVVWSGFSKAAIILFLLSLFSRMFGITAGFHRYFSHKTFKTSRVFQFFLALLGTSAAQHGPLWWASHHRHHHRYADQKKDIHPPSLRGLAYAHMGWLFKHYYYPTIHKRIQDFAKFKELKWLDDNHRIVPISYAILMYFIGVITHHYVPSWGLNGFQSFVWGFVLSTVALYHLTFTINSLMHRFGSRGYNTNDTSKNNFFLAILTMGEGWHNNHHRYPSSERQGFFWWQIDFTHYILKLFESLGLIWDIKSPPNTVLAEYRAGTLPTA